VAKPGLRPMAARFAWAISPTSRMAMRIRLLSHPLAGRAALEIGVVMQKGAISGIGKNLDEAARRFRVQPAARHSDCAHRRSPKVVGAAVFEFMRSFLEALVIVLAVSFLSLGWRTGIVWPCRCPCARHRIIAMAFLGPRSATRDARRAHHRARPDGR